MGTVLAKMARHVEQHDAGLWCGREAHHGLRARVERLEAALAAQPATTAEPTEPSTTARTKQSEGDGEDRMPEDMRRGLQAKMTPERVVFLRRSWGGVRGHFRHDDYGILSTELLGRLTTRERSRDAARKLVLAFRTLGYLMPPTPGFSTRTRTIVAPEYRVL